MRPQSHASTPPPLPPPHAPPAPRLQLEAAGLVAKLEGTSGGRYVTSEGKKEVDTVARSAILTA
jgi:hypothetical protein